MTRQVLVRLESASRNPFEVVGFTFGQGESAVAVIAGLRGSEASGVHVASALVAWLRAHPERLVPGQKLLVVPAANPASLNVGRRFWGLDDTDINRMFPGYAEGETTQRIAARLMEALTGWRWGVNLTSINHPGTYLPHVRLHETGYEDLDGARAFGLPDIHLHHPNAQETGSLNYNWQVWATKAYSLVGGRAFTADASVVENQVRALRRFLVFAGVLTPETAGSPTLPASALWRDGDLTRVPSTRSGLFHPLVAPGARVARGQLLAGVSHALTGEVEEEIRAPVAGKVFYALEAPLIHSRMVAFTLVPGVTMEA